ncbi:hypothetical protein NQ317_012749 [Molorchus minor]|uniref:Galectin n=1 Tax=Molorchus minor TaxID=1323400 RepID=A0ABQ9K0G3_9CUCU|nr:hypothetical protein NQ317_012749 [Molorchus minor]
MYGTRPETSGAWISYTTEDDIRLLHDVVRCNVYIYKATFDDVSLLFDFFTLEQKTKIIKHKLQINKVIRGLWQANSWLEEHGFRFEVAYSVCRRFISVKFTGEWIAIENSKVLFANLPVEFEIMVDTHFDSHFDEVLIVLNSYSDQN